MADRRDSSPTPSTSFVHRCGRTATQLVYKRTTAVARRVLCERLPLPGGACRGPQLVRTRGRGVAF